MPLLPMSEILDRAYAEGYGVPAFDTWNAETTAAILGLAQDLQAPVILMHAGPDYGILSPRMLADMTRLFMGYYKVPAALHLDHGRSLEQVQDCLDAGYTSVMLDYSAKPFQENAAALRETVARAHPLGVTVEAEIGHVGRAGASHESSGASTLTDAQEAADFVAQTGVDALAVSIGNAHGHYTALPQFDFERLAQIRDAVNLPLVLHGGSGTPDDELRRAISLGITKVNVVTELVTAVRQSLLDQWGESRNKHIPFAYTEATQAMLPVAEKWFRVCGAVGKAG